MKFILSRKGFDSQYGGYPSPVLPDGKLISFPIPDTKGISYNELKLKENYTYKDLMDELKIKLTCNKGHLDPDLCQDIYLRDKDWLPLFGQCNAAAGHLKKYKISEGDIFLFFGTFQKTIQEEDMLKFDKNDKPKHLIYAYFQIGDIIDSESKLLSWMKYHPHSSRFNVTNNTIYVARKKLSFGNFPGAGVFRFKDELVLTAENMSKSKWKLFPNFLRGNISYHSDASWKDNYFQSGGKGQEFVISESKEIEDWFKDLILKNISNE